MAVTTNQTGRLVDADYDNVKDTFPVSSAGTGTISTVNGADRFVVGVGTSFLTEVEVGEFIWFKTADELAKVESIVSDTELYLVSAPATTATGDTFGVVPKVPYSSISWMIDADGAADVNGVTYPANTSRVYGNGKPNTSGGGRRLTPLLIDATANANNVYVSGE